MRTYFIGNQHLDSRDGYDSDENDEDECSFGKCMALAFILVWVLMILGMVIAAVCMRTNVELGPHNACGSKMIFR